MGFTALCWYGIGMEHPSPAAGDLAIMASWLLLGAAFSSGGIPKQVIIGEQYALTPVLVILLLIQLAILFGNDYYWTALIRIWATAWAFTVRGLARAQDEIERASTQ